MRAIDTEFCCLTELNQSMFEMKSKFDKIKREISKSIECLFAMNKSTVSAYIITFAKSQKITRTGFHWTPEGKRKRGGPRTT